MVFVTTSFASSISLAMTITISQLLDMEISLSRINSSTSRLLLTFTQNMSQQMLEAHATSNHHAIAKTPREPSRQWPAVFHVCPTHKIRTPSCRINVFVTNAATFTWVQTIRVENKNKTIKYEQNVNIAHQSNSKCYVMWKILIKSSFIAEFFFSQNLSIFHAHYIFL